MNFTGQIKNTNPNAVGQAMHQLISRLYPICRSITGNGFRETLGILQDYVPLEIHSVASGTKVFDWTIPREWNIRDAYIKNPRGEKILDFKNSNLHVLSYSVPTHLKLSLEELKEHVFTLPEYPDWIPYRTSYYKENWGFCMSHKQLASLQEGEYEVRIDSTLENGTLNYGEYYVKGKRQEEVLVSCHACHPSLCNDNLSGVALATFLAKTISSLDPELSYRFLFIPGSIGSITWLNQNEESVSRIKSGFVAACVGDSGKVTYKKSRKGNAEIDRAGIHVLKHSGNDHEILEFSPYGYDERQFGSPGFNLPIGCFMRTPFAQFPEYHTSADNLEFVRPESLGDSFEKCLQILNVLENNRTYLNTNPKCEPQLGKRGLYRSIGGSAEGDVKELAILWVLNLSDGDHSLLDIAEQSKLEFIDIQKAAGALLSKDLLRPCAK